MARDDITLAEIRTFLSRIDSYLIRRTEAQLSPRLQIAAKLLAGAFAKPEELCPAWHRTIYEWALDHADALLAADAEAAKRAE